MVTDSQPMVVTDTDCGARRRGLPMLRPSLRLMPGLDMVDSMATVLVWAMAAMATEGLATDMERGLLMLRPNLRLMPGYGYGGLGYAYGKRSADAKPEADAWYGYGGLYGYGLPAYGAYGLGYGYGKRSADAEADAWYGYGGLYGYGLPAYGGYGYGLWGKK